MGYVGTPIHSNRCCPLGRRAFRALPCQRGALLCRQPGRERRAGRHADPRPIVIHIDEPGKAPRRHGGLILQRPERNDQ